MTRSLTLILGLLAGLGVGGCYVYDPLYCKSNEDCNDAPDDRRYCDQTGTLEASNFVANTCVKLDTTIDGGADASAEVEFDASTSGDSSPADAARPDAEIPTECTPNTATCDRDSNEYSECGPTGEFVVFQRLCALGCHPIQERCFDLDPSNGLEEALNRIDAMPPGDVDDLDVPAGAVIDTLNGIVTAGGQDLDVDTMIIHQIGNQDIFVLLVNRLILRDAIVKGDKPFAIVANGDVTIDGVVDLGVRIVNNGSGSNGPGVADCAAGPGVGISGDDGNGGGAGGGFGTAGGHGGNGFNGLRGGLAGPVAGSDTIVPLRGGCMGGSAGGTAGNAGGAIQIVSRTKIAVGSTGSVITHGGRGGKALEVRPCINGVPCANNALGGGGSGGAILFEAPTVTVATGAALGANGGGGGGANRLGGSPTNTQGGTTTATQFPTEYGRGGVGSNGVSPAGDGTNGTIYGGSGGGGAGRIRVNSVVDFAPAGTVFPPASEGPLTRR